MELKLIDNSGASSSTVTGHDNVFGREFNEGLVHQVIVAYQANARMGTRKQKERGEIAKSTRKPWRQKGTGRARAGMASSPLWRGGGKIFASSPEENFSHKVNRKMYRAGMAAIFSQLAREGRMCVVDQFAIDAPKTKMLAEKIRAMGFEGLLILTDEYDERLYLSSRNLPNVLVTEVRYVNPMVLIGYPNVVLTRKAVAKIEEMLQ